MILYVLVLQKQRQVKSRLRPEKELRAPVFPFQWFQQVVAEKGSCFTFNHENIGDHLSSIGMESELTQNTAGEKFGLKLVLDVQTVIHGLYQL